MSKRERRTETVSEPGTLPAWVPPLVYVVASIALFRAFVFSDQMLFGSDTLGLGYLARQFYADALRSLGGVPDWAPLILGGVPFLESLSGGDALYPPSVLSLLLFEPYRALGWKAVLHVAAAGLLMFGWLRAIDASRAAAFIGGLGYMLAPFFVSLTFPGNDGRMFVTALAPLLFWVVSRHFDRPRARTFAGIGLTVALILSTTQFQLAYFLFGATGLFAAFRAWRLWADVDHQGAAKDGGAARSEVHVEASAVGEGERSEGSRRSSGGRRAAVRFALFLTASVAGLGAAAVQFAPAVDYATGSSRRVATTREAAGETSVEWSASWSMHPEEAMSLLVPEFPGASGPDADWASNSYWGRNAFKLNSEYIGVVLLFLAVLSFLGGARPALRWFFAGLGALALLFALGANTPLWRILYEVVPGIRLFRAPSQAIFLTGFSVATLAALGVDRILRVTRDDDDAWRRLFSGLAVGSGFMLLLLAIISSGAIVGLWTTIVYRDIPPGRLATFQGFVPLLSRGAGIAFLLVTIAGLLAWALRARKLPAGVVVAGLALLVAVDEARIDAPFIQVMDFHAWAEPDAHVQAILRREGERNEPYRLLSLVDRGQDVSPAMHGIELAAGHHPNDLNRYRQLIGMVGSGNPDNLLRSTQIRRLLNVRYILWPDYQLGASPQGTVVSRLQYGNGETHSTLLAEPGLPRARLVGAAVVLGEEEAVPYMLSESFDPEREVVLAEAPPVELDGAPVQGGVEWLERTPDLLRMRVTSDRRALLVVADNWYEGWRARVDGEESPVLRAYHTLRAVPVAPGEHTVEMTYESSVLRWSGLVSVLFLLGLCAAGVLDLALERRRAEA